MNCGYLSLTHFDAKPSKKKTEKKIPKKQCECVWRSPSRPKWSNQRTRSKAEEYKEKPSRNSQPFLGKRRELCWFQGYPPWNYLPVRTWKEAGTQKSSSNHTFSRAKMWVLGRVNQSIVHGCNFPIRKMKGWRICQPCWDSCGRCVS